VVVFAGGAPTGSFGNSLVQTASSGSLALNNAGDTVTLFDPNATPVASIRRAATINRSLVIQMSLARSLVKQHGERLRRCALLAGHEGERRCFHRPAAAADIYADPDQHTHTYTDPDTHIHPNAHTLHANAVLYTHTTPGPTPRHQLQPHAHTYADRNADQDADGDRHTPRRHQVTTPTDTPTPTPSSTSTATPRNTPTGTPMDKPFTSRSSRASLSRTAPGQQV
jgi:hypothetical protein